MADPEKFGLGLLQFTNYGGLAIRNSSENFSNESILLMSQDISRIGSSAEKIFKIELNNSCTGHYDQDEEAIDYKEDAAPLDDYLLN